MSSAIKRLLFPTRLVSSLDSPTFFIIKKNSNQFLLQKKKEKYIDIESVTDPRRDPTRKNARKNLSNPIYHIEKRGANERDSHRFPNCFVKKKKWKKEEEEEEENERRRRREGPSIS